MLYISMLFDEPLVVRNLCILASLDPPLCESGRWSMLELLHCIWYWYTANSYGWWTAR